MSGEGLSGKMNEYQREEIRIKDAALSADVQQKRASLQLEHKKHLVTCVSLVVTVLGSVASGSEIIAGGSIHVYGTLRGRAMAGTKGDGRARIFCRKNEAELLAINGFYRTAEDWDDAIRSHAIHSWLENGVLKVAPLD